MRSATSSSLRVCAASAICSANPRLFAAGSRSITIGALAVSARCRWLAPRLCTPALPRTHPPPSSACIPLHPPASVPLHANLCALPTFKDTATTEGHRHSGVPERPRCTRTSGRRPPAPPSRKWHRNSQMAPAYRCHLSNAVPLRGRTARNGTASAAERVVRPHRWRAHPHSTPICVGSRHLYVFCHTQLTRTHTVPARERVNGGGGT